MATRYNPKETEPKWRAAWERAQVFRILPAHQKGEATRFGGITRIERTERRSRRKCPPERRPQALHAPALLVDQNERIGASDGVEAVANKAADLVVCHTVAREDDDACRPR